MKWTADKINVGLVLFSALCATIIPIEALILSYIVLGPLHYLTEVSWLHDRNYFTPSRSKTLLVLGSIYLVFLIFDKRDGGFLPHLMLFSLGLSICMVLFGINWKSIIGGFAAMSVLSLGLTPSNFMALISLKMVSSLIHVYGFTGIFILLGALKGKSKWGMATFVLFLLAPLFLWHAPIPQISLSEYWQRFIPPFFTVAEQMVIVFDLSHHDLSPIFRIISFAFLYHFLNWFSKTKVIGWGNISRTRLTVIFALWLTSLSLFFYSFVLGFVVLSTLSLFHIVMEFPLNVVSGRALIIELMSYPRALLARLKNGYPVRREPVNQPADHPLSRWSAG